MNEPEHIAISKSKGVHIDWKDNHHSEYGLQYLRDQCPCATCTGAHGTPPAAPAAANPLQMFKPAMRIVEVEPVGQHLAPEHQFLLRRVPADLLAWLAQ